MHSTFVEGNGSDQRELLTDAVLFNFDDIVVSFCKVLETLFDIISSDSATVSREASSCRRTEERVE